jgi:hypothetical protein
MALLSVDGCRRRLDASAQRARPLADLAELIVRHAEHYGR